MKGESEKVVVNGLITDEAYVSIDNRGFTLGDGLFETMSLYGGAPFMLAEHLDRLAKGAQAIGLHLPVDQKKLSFAIAELASSNKVTRGVARLTVTRGFGKRGYASVGSGPASWFLTVRKYEPPDAKRNEGGYRLVIAPIKADPSSVLRGIKSISALEKAIAMDFAVKQGFDEALSLTQQGHASSCQASNIFWVKDGRLYTPSLDCAILPGITRKAIIDLAGKTGMELAEGKYEPAQLEKAGEVFLTNSLIEVMPVASIEGLAEYPGPGQVTQKLLADYRRRI